LTGLFRNGVELFQPWISFTKGFFRNSLTIFSEFVFQFWSHHLKQWLQQACLSRVSAERQSER
jgi:hypothetical protein